MLNGITLGIIITGIMLFGGILLTVIINALLAPTIKTPNKVIGEVIDIIDLKKKDIFLDLGCGDGRVVLEAYRYAKCKCFGYDISPIMIILARTKRILSFPMSKDIVLEADNIFSVDLENITKVYCYLDQKTMNALRKKFEPFIENSGVVYSYKYSIQNLKKEKKIKLNNGEILYVYERDGGKQKK